MRGFQHSKSVIRDTAESFSSEQRPHCEMEAHANEIPDRRQPVHIRHVLKATKFGNQSFGSIQVNFYVLHVPNLPNNATKIQNAMKLS